jgi:protein phosphatase
MRNAIAKFDSGAATHVGKLRQRNEDRYLVRPEFGLWAVADGMGGHHAGDLASRTVIDALNTMERPASAADLLARCEESVVRANGRLKAIATERGVTIGTTLAVLLAYGGHYACLWAGDSRIYLIRAGRIAQISRDHTELQELLADRLIDPKEAKRWSGRNVVTRAIGVHDAPELDIESGKLEPGDTFVICSDGLTNHVDDDEILDCVKSRQSQQACDALIALTLARGASDNVTLIVVRYEPGGAEPRTSMREREHPWE